MRIDQAVNIEDLHRMAKRRLPKIAFDFIEGGLEDERGLERNTSAFHKHRLLPRYLVDVSRRDQSQTLFGRTYSSPFGISPTGAAGLGDQGRGWRKNDGNAGQRRAARRRHRDCAVSWRTIRVFWKAYAVRRSCRWASWCQKGGGHLARRNRPGDGPDRLSAAWPARSRFLVAGRLAAQYLMVSVSNRGRLDARRDRPPRSRKLVSLARDTLQKRCAFYGGPRVRILLPPAVSPVRTTAGKS